MRFREVRMDLIEIYVDEDIDERLDYYISKILKDRSRTYINKLIKNKLVLVNGEVVKPRYIVKNGDLIQVKLPKEKNIEIIPENIPIDIIFEDRDILVINKPKGMVIHPTPNNTSGTLVNALLYYDKNISSVGEALRPGIVHRLDKDTSGIIVIAKNQKAYKNLIEQFKLRKVKRVYIALIYGQLDIKEATINAPIGRDPANRTKMTVIYENSKEAITDYKVLQEFTDYSLVELSLQTGRTHQIRVHMAYLGHPIVGDMIYSNKKDEFNLDSQLLHAKKIGFYHPRNKEYLEFEAEFPENFTNIIKILEKRNW